MKHILLGWGACQGGGGACSVLSRGVGRGGGGACSLLGWGAIGGGVGNGNEEPFQFWKMNQFVEYNNYKLYMEKN